jgi:ribosomal protein L22
MLKRFKAGARGRYKPRKRRTSHVTVILAQRGEK